MDVTAGELGQAPDRRALPPRGSDILVDLLAEEEVAKNAARFLAGMQQQQRGRGEGKPS